MVFLDKDRRWIMCRNIIFVTILLLMLTEKFSSRPLDIHTRVVKMAPTQEKELCAAQYVKMSSVARAQQEFDTSHTRDPRERKLIDTWRKQFEARGFI
jgi:hypothetical protein